MKLGLIGLGRMGNAIAQRLVDAGHEVIGFDLDPNAQEDAKKIGVQLVATVPEVAEHARITWLMVPVGEPVDAVIGQLKEKLKRGDIIIDGGNSFYGDSVRRARALQNDGIFFVDCGTSGGVHGRANGFCLMVGCDVAVYTKIHSLLLAIAAPGGVAHVGPSGAGHYVKMVHNGIEYGLLQAYAEGFHILKEGSYQDIGLNFEEISRIWQSSSVIRSFLLELGHNVFEKDQQFTNVSGEVAEGGTGKWTLEEADKFQIPAPVLEASLKTRRWSRETGGNYATKFIALLREQFGGHEVKKLDEEQR